MDPTDKDTTTQEPAIEEREASTPRAVRWLPSELERLKQAAEVLSARERLNLNTADVIRRGALKEADEILSAA